jgi:hypothetical protein
MAHQRTAEPVRVCIDPGGLYAITCHADGWMRLWDLTTGRLAAKAGGDGDMVTAACVSPDCSRLVSVGGDGCVCIWRLPASESRQMAAAAARIAAAKAPRLATPASPGALHAESHSAHATAARRAAWEPGFTSPASAAVLGTTGRGDNAAISQTLLRVRQGRPLVPAEFLPRWAQGSTLPQERDTLGENAAAAGEGAAVGEPPCPAAGQAPCSTWGADAAGGSGAAIPAGGRWAEALARELPVYDEKGRPVATLKVRRRWGCGLSGCVRMRVRSHACACVHARVCIGLWPGCRALAGDQPSRCLGLEWLQQVGSASFSDPASSSLRLPARDASFRLRVHHPGYGWLSCPRG